MTITTAETVEIHTSFVDLHIKKHLLIFFFYIPEDSSGTENTIQTST